MTYHLNEKTQRVNICRAQTPETCPLKKDDKTAPHFNDKESAQKYLTQQLEKNYGTLPLAKTKQIKIHAMTETENLALTNRMIEENRALEKHLSISEMNSLHYYSFSGSGNINRLLNGITEHHGQPINVEQNLSHIERLDNIFEKMKNEAKTPRKLYRYLRIDKKDNIQDYIDKNFGNGEYTDKGFMSTTEDPSMIVGYAKRFSKNAQYVVLEINTDKGISLQTKEEQIGDLLTFEKERLLPRDMKFSVDDVSDTLIKVDDSRRKLIAQFSGRGFYNEDNAPKSMRHKPFKVIRLTELG